ncbi:ATP-binding protein [Flectobacillus sp. BAB-3569]|uniref:ATP-binding protein n=1 Tax=Flectobacillus sp. BAB-3569 TaxID=1509483 RepID=UPI001C3C4F60|nr:ATP-binding protein [Flectobacillus sp. BAB-3569]
MDENKINIRPNVSILSVLKYVEYETWFALAEFVDNAIASFINNRERLLKLHGKEFKLEVRIEIIDSENKIIIRDNAGGIEQSQYQRAFRAAEIPSDTSGLSEFGMGMKSAACWFSDMWTVRTTALNEAVEKTIKFDIRKIVEDKLEELEFTSTPVDENLHYTIIELNNVNKMPRGRSIGKVKSHLKSIYRDFLRKGTLNLIFDNSTLIFEEPKVLFAPKYDEPYGEKIEWKKT